MMLVPRVVGLANVPDPSELVLQKAFALLQVPVPPRALGLHHTFVKVCAEEVSGNKTIEQKTATASTTPIERSRAAVPWVRRSESLLLWGDEAATRGEVEEFMVRSVIFITRTMAPEQVKISLIAIDFLVQNNRFATPA